MTNAVSNLMREAARARRESRLVDARRSLTEAVTLCRQSGESGELVQALKGLGQVERDLGSAMSALPLYEEAVAICRKGDDTLALAHTVRHLADIHQDRGRTDLAEPYYQEALMLYRSNEQTNPLDLANAVRPLAMLKEGAGQIGEARRLWREARDLYVEAGVEAGLAESEARLAHLGG
jgi:tetratricopeptide (TPR) repeat protein